MQILIRLILRTPWALPCLLWFVGILLAGCLGLGAAVSIQSARLDAADARETVLADKIDMQNQAVERWKSAAEQQAAQATDAAQRAARVRTVTVERIKTIAAAPIPRDCQDAVRWAAEQGAEFNLQWEAVEQ